MPTRVPFQSSTNAVAERNIRAVEEGRADREMNVLKGAPHTSAVCLAMDWSRPYSREEAAFPAPWVREHKFWPTVSRIDNGFGDKNLICTCPSVEELAEAQLVAHGGLPSAVG